MKYPPGSRSAYHARVSPPHTWRRATQNELSELVSGGLAEGEGEPPLFRPKLGCQTPGNAPGYQPGACRNRLTIGWGAVQRPRVGWYRTRPRSDFIEEILRTQLSKAHHGVRVGDVLTFPKGRYIRVVKVLVLGTRRGPAVEARTLYEDLNPPESARALPRRPDLGQRPAGEGRPTKKDRRSIDRLRARD